MVQHIRTLTHTHPMAVRLIGIGVLFMVPFLIQQIGLIPRSTSMGAILLLIGLASAGYGITDFLASHYHRIKTLARIAAFLILGVALVWAIYR